MEYWGYHMIVDVAKCDMTAITTREVIHDFVLDLVKAIDMTAFGEPTIEHFATHDPDKAGYSLVQLIETSNICAHFVDKDGSAYFDIFSCKPFDSEVVVDVIRKHFKPEYWTIHLILRRAPGPLVGSEYHQVTCEEGKWCDAY